MSEVNYETLFLLLLLADVIVIVPLIWMWSKISFMHDEAVDACMDYEMTVKKLENELERWSYLHGADDPEDSIRQDSVGKEARLLDERLNQIRELESQLTKERT